MAAYQTILEAVVKDPNQPVGRLPMLAEEQVSRVLGDDFPVTNFENHSETVCSLIDEQVNLAPDAIAVSCGEGELTYGELERESDQIARQLQKLGVGPNAVVGVCIEPSLHLPVALLSVLKAGGAYVLLDTSASKEILTHILADAQIAIILADGHGAWYIPESSCRVLRVDLELCEDASNQWVEKSIPIAPEHLASIIYKREKNGNFRGVEITHDFEVIEV